MQVTQRSRWPKVLGLVLVVGILAGVLTQAQSLADWWKLRGYDPPANVTKLATDTTMSDEARHYFYLNHPNIAGKSTFTANCPAGDEQTIVLGCYLGGENGIYLLSVSDKRLYGVEQVTAAHEMLHAAYERLGGSEKEHIDGLLQDYFSHGLRDKRIRDTLKSYEKSEPGQELNEMHSIFGTEIKSLPKELEEYYRQYFANRQKVAEFATNYQAAFTSRQTSIKQYDAQLSAWKQQINDNEQQLTTQQAELEAEQRRLHVLNTRDDIDAYNAAVVVFNAKVNQFNALLDETKSLIAQYNQLVEKRNAIALEESELQKALTGSLPSAR